MKLVKALVLLCAVLMLCSCSAEKGDIYSKESCISAEYADFADSA